MGFWWSFGFYSLREPAAGSVANVDRSLNCAHGLSLPAEEPGEPPCAGLDYLLRYCWPASRAGGRTRRADYPDKPIKLVVPFVPGSPVDVHWGDVVSQRLGARLGQSVVVDNRPGGGTSTATKAVVAAPADGYTLLMSGQTLAYLGLFYPDLGFDPMKAFAPVATLAGWSHVLVVTPSVPAAHAGGACGTCQRPIRASSRSVSVSAPRRRLLGEYLKVVAGLDLVSSALPRRRAGPHRLLLGGRIRVNFAPVSNVAGDDPRARSVRSRVHRRGARPTCPMFRPRTESGYPRRSASTPTSGGRSWRHQPPRLRP